MILVVGYGNPLRRDDAIGQHIARMLVSRMHDRAEVITTYQLTPELVEPISHAELVIFIDARIGDMPGTINQETVVPLLDAGAFTHHVSPEALLGAAGELYEKTPQGILISIIGASFDIGSELSPELEQILPILVDQVEKIIMTHAELSRREGNNHARIWNS